MVVRVIWKLPYGTPFLLVGFFSRSSVHGVQLMLPSNQKSNTIFFVVVLILFRIEFHDIFRRWHGRQTCKENLYKLLHIFLIFWSDNQIASFARNANIQRENYLECVWCGKIVLSVSETVGDIVVPQKRLFAYNDKMQNDFAVWNCVHLSAWINWAYICLLASYKFYEIVTGRDEDIANRRKKRDVFVWQWHLLTAKLVFDGKRPTQNTNWIFLMAFW